MKRTQKIAVTVTVVAFLLAAGLIETMPLMSMLMLAVMGAAIVKGGLNELR